MRFSSLFYSVLFIVVFHVSCDLPIENDLQIEEVIPETAVFGTVLTNDDQIEAFLKSDLLSLIDSKSAFSASEFAKQEVFGNSQLEQLSISWHSVRKEELAPLFIAKTTKSPEIIVSSLSGTYEFEGESDVRDYNGNEIYSNSSNIGSFTYTVANGFIAFSFTEVLVEDFIRALTNEESRLIVGSQPALFYVNNARLDEIIDSSSSLDFGFLNHGVTNLDINEDDGLIAFNGVSNVSTDDNSYNGAIFAESYIPSNNLFITWSNMGDEDNASLVEVGLKVYEENQSVFLFKNADTQNYKNELSQLAKEGLAESDSLPYQESFAGADILYIKGDYFSDLLQRQELKGGAFCAVIDQIVLVSSSDEGIRQCLASHADETTIGQLVNERLFIQKLIQDTYFTQIIKSQDKSTFDQLVLQANVVNSGMLVNGVLKLPNTIDEVSNDSERSIALKANSFLDVEASTRAFVLMNHTTRQREVVIQDEQNNLYQINLEGELNWQKKLSNSIKSPILQVDYYNNGKLQYLFATDSLVHLIDRNGEAVDAFPKEHGIKDEIVDLVLIDYDKTKRYRYLIETGRGKLHLFDKEVNRLDGWSPLNLEAVLLNSIFHARIAGKDFYPIVERSNQIHLINRRGEDYPGFPKNIDMRFSGDIYLDRNPAFGQSKIWVISDLGKLVSVNLLGKIESDEQWVRPINESKFQLLADVLGSGFVITRSENEQTVILDKDQNELFKIFQDSNSETELKYYRFGNGGEVLLLWNKETSIVNVYDMQGKELVSGIDSAFEPSLLYFQNTRTYQMFVNLANEVNIYEFSSSTE